MGLVVLLHLWRLGQKRWYFTEIEADEDSIDDVRAVENELYQN